MQVKKLGRQSKNTEKKPAASSLSSNKMLTILEYLAECWLPVRLQDISEDIGMSQPSVLRYLNSLISNNYVFQEENSYRYGLTWKIRRLANQVDTHMSIRNIVSPFLNMLANRFDVGTCLVKEQDYQAIYVDFIGKKEGNLNYLRIGIKAPLHATASGKLILSTYQEWQIDEMISKVGLEKITEKTIENKQALLDELELVRSRGYSIDDEECERSNRGVSVPLYDYSDRIVAAISVVDMVENLSYEKINDDILPVMKEYARKISKRMGSSLFD